jgi:hypothetical protein
MTEKNSEKSSVKRAAAVAQKAGSRKLNSNEVEVSTGVIFGVKPVPQFILSDIRREFKEPPVPTWFNKDTGRKEPNPDDPEYKKSYNDYIVGLSMAVIDVMVLMGTYSVSVPKGVPEPTSETWKNELGAILRARGWSRSDIAELSDEERYVFWVKYRAATGGGVTGEDSDINRITLAIGRLSGVAEEDVRDATDNFRDTD